MVGGIRIELNEPIVIIEVTKEEFSNLVEKGDILFEKRETTIITKEGLEYKLSVGNIVIVRCSVDEKNIYTCNIELVCSTHGAIKLKKYNAVF